MLRDETDQTINGNAERRLSSIFAAVFGLPQDRIHPDLGPDQVERWDSLGHVMLVAAIQEEFLIEFEVDEIMEFTTFQAILSAVESRMAATFREGSAEGKGAR
jgi:acyl carrier protein